MDFEAEMRKKAEAARAASRKLSVLPTGIKNKALLAMAEVLEKRSSVILAANEQDLEAARQKGLKRSYLDRLMLNESRISQMAEGLRQTAQLPDPVSQGDYSATRPNGLEIRRIRVPLGVIGIIYEARPNVSFDVFALCFKSGNACVLKGGRDAEESNRAIVGMIRRVLCEQNVDEHVVELLPATHEATAEMLCAVGYIDLCIPRGGKRLIAFVRDNARVPVIETGAGVVHAYFDKCGDTTMGQRIIKNAKTRRVSVCNALDTLIIHQDRLQDLPALVAPLLDNEPPVTLYADERAHAVLNCTSEKESLDFDREFMSYAMNIKTVDSLDEALEHISRYGSGHSECIITEDEQAARRFQQEVDAACVYWNAPTSFTDGAQFGLGAEIGISTQKLGPRGPMGLEELTTYKYAVTGDGVIRKG